MSREEIIMQRCFELAKRAEGNVSPNPLVGAVLVYDNRIISEGWHEKYGEAHAEVNAIRDVDNDILKKSQLYVNLEPCNHFGKTPPCSDLIVSKNIPKVFISILDPNPLVSGSGIQKLEKAGIDIKSGILEDEGRQVNRRFLCRIEKNRPYIVLKWAQTSDGHISGPNGTPLKISNEVSQQLSHKMRAEEDAIMVGTNTVKKDNPSLTTRYWEGKNPLRITLDLKDTLDRNSNIFNNQADTLVYRLSKSAQIGKSTFIELKDKEDVIDQILADLNRRQINSLIVEGGSTLLNQFISRKLYDEIHVFKSPEKSTQGVNAPDLDLDSANYSKLLKGDTYYFFKIN